MSDRLIQINVGQETDQPPISIPQRSLRSAFGRYASPSLKRKRDSQQVIAAVTIEKHTRPQRTGDRAKNEYNEGSAAKKMEQPSESHAEPRGEKPFLIQQSLLCSGSDYFVKAIKN